MAKCMWRQAKVGLEELKCVLHRPTFGMTSTVLKTPPHKQAKVKFNAKYDDQVSTERTYFPEILQRN